MENVGTIGQGGADLKDGGLGGNLSAASPQLVWAVARELTHALERSRHRLLGLASDVGRGAGGALKRLRRGTLALAAAVEPGRWLEDVYALAGVASVAALAELDERVDDVEVRVVEVASERAHAELLLLRQRVGELESLAAALGGDNARRAVEGLSGRVDELERRMNSYPRGAGRHPF